MKYLLMGIVFLFTTTAVGAQQPDELQIKNLLSKQVTQWNKGNVEGYMIGYWENDSLVFIGKNGPTYGYQPTLERYKRSYPTPEAMGQLTSTILSLQRLSDTYFFVMGKWELKRKEGDLKGSYTLLLRKIGGKWVIINDHSS